MYQLDAQVAKESDQIGGFLADTGKYIGKFSRAEKLVSANKGTHGIGFTFVADNGQSTRFDIWTMNAQNEPLSGLKSINALMACMKLRNISFADGEVERYDYDTKQSYTEKAQVFPDLVGRPIGLLLRSTEYEKMRDGHKTGETGWRLELYGAFEAATGFTAGEIMDKKQKPEQLAKMEAMLADRPLKKGAARASTPAAGGQQGRTLADMDDDIPF